MIHLRLRVPDDRLDTVVEQLLDDDGVTNLVVTPDAFRKPRGGLVEADIAREGAQAVVSRLRRLDLHHEGSITLTEPDTLLSDAADAAEVAAPGSPDDSLVWDVVEHRVRKESQLSFAFVAFLALAVLIAGTGRLLDPPILIVGAMVVGPEFSPIAALCVGLARPRPSLLPSALRTLVLGYLIAIAVAVPFWWVAHLLGHASEQDASTGTLTDFIVKPDGWSFVVAVLAGIAGILALTTAKSGPLVGVFISVTTVPAAGTIALCLGTGTWREITPALVQLLLNIGGLVLAGTTTLLLQKAYWHRVSSGHTTWHRD
jgi:uncharacterized hydrophobic protein (TIGR00271 family)